MRTRFHVAITIGLLAALIVSGCSLIDDSDEAGSTTTDGPDPNAGTIIIRQQTVPAGQAGSFTYTGVPTGTISGDSTLVVSDLAPGTYTTTEVDPAPDFDVTAVECDDDESTMPSSADRFTRTAVVNLDPGETVTCTFTNAQRGTLVIASRTEPEGAAGSFQFTGSPTGTIPSNGTLVVANLEPGTYSSTERDPAPEFDVTAVECDDEASPFPSSGDASSRTAIFDLDPGEMVTCTFTNTRRGSAVIASQTEPEGAAGNFLFTGVPSGTVSANGSLVVANLVPGTYTSTEADPSPDFEVTAAECDDGDSATPSSADVGSRTAVFNIDPGEQVTCTFTNSEPGAEITPTVQAGGVTGGISGGDGGPDAGDGEGTNPFVNPDEDMDNFPLPDEVPPDAGTYAAPRPGPWSVTHYAGQMDCGVMSLPIPASPPETGTLEVTDGGRTVIGTGLRDAGGVSITMNADPAITGRYTGSFQAVEEGVPFTINYFWQVVTDEHVVGFLTASVTSEGVSCTVYRSYEMRYAG